MPAAESAPDVLPLGVLWLPVVPAVLLLELLEDGAPELLLEAVDVLGD